MRCIRAACLMLIAVIAMSIAGTAIAQAEEPYWKVKGARLKAGSTKEFTLTGIKSYVIRGKIEGTPFALTCMTSELSSPGKIIGAEPEQTQTDVGPVGFLKNAKQPKFCPNAG